MTSAMRGLLSYKCDCSLLCSFRSWCSFRIFHISSWLKWRKQYVQIYSGLEFTTLALSLHRVTYCYSIVILNKDKFLSVRRRFTLPRQTSRGIPSSAVMHMDGELKALPAIYKKIAHHEPRTGFGGSVNERPCRCCTIAH